MFYDAFYKDTEDCTPKVGETGAACISFCWLCYSVPISQAMAMTHRSK